MGKRLVIVESPTKAKTIEKYLGEGFVVTSSYGHVRDLPNNAAEIPAKVKKEPWSRLGIHIDNEFEPLYIVPDSKKKRVKELKNLLKDAEELLLATDEDREGESISWHLLDVLKPKVPVRRLVFHEITKTAIKESLENPREVNQDLVKAQETRRLIDRLFGYSVSPLLWKKVKPKLSAGRVQSVATRLLCERERARMAFVSAAYWGIKAEFKTNNSSDAPFEAELVSVGDKRVAIGKDFDPDTGKIIKPDDVILLEEAKAKEIAEQVAQGTISVTSVESKPFTTRPSPPFTTSTLQQEAIKRYSFSARRTMSIAQTLYENGLITYMRTDSTTLSSEAIDGARNLIATKFGKEFLPDQARVYKTKVKNAQEAHEAIRPAGSNFADPKEVKRKFGVEVGKLYELIWKRTMASQMRDAEGTRVAVRINAGEAQFRSSGKTISFPGYLRAYVEGSEDPKKALAEQDNVLPPLVEQQALQAHSVDPARKETRPPARYTEGSLIKELERLGIGRPSTWATIVGVVLSRNYAFKKGNALVPTFLAMVLTSLMENYFSNLVDYSFTASMEDDLDAISRGEQDNLEYLTKFYFGNGHRGLKELVENGEENIDPREVCGMGIGTTPAGRAVEVRIGRYGPFLTDNNESRAAIPEFLAPDELSPEKAEQLLVDAERGPQPLGDDPETGKPVYVKTGRFGPYVQLGDMEEGSDEKPKMVSLIEGITTENITFEDALGLLSLPRLLGKDEHGIEVTANNGRYGPYVTRGDDTRSIPSDEDYNVLTIKLEHALELLKQPRRRGRRGPSKPLKELEKHPVTDKQLVIKSGRFGPYVTDGEINASIPKGMQIDAVSMEDAVNLLEARKLKLEEKARLEEESGGSSTKKASKKKTKSKSKSKSKSKAKSKSKSKSKTKAKSKSKSKAKSKKKSKSASK